MARPPGFSLAEALRTVGGALEPHGAQRARLHVTTGGVTVEATAGGRAYTWDELLALSREQQRQRQAQVDTTSWVAPLALTHWPALLRIVGQLLDTRRVTTCEIDATLAPIDAPRDCQLRALVGDDVVVDGDDVQMHLLRVRTQQIAVQQPPTPLESAAPSHPWWAIWRRD